MTVCPRTGQSVLGGPCGTRIARYEVEKLLGDGGMGAVYRARHVMLNQAVAIKLLHAEFSRRGDMLERFLREARAAATIGNPHIIRVHDCDVTPEGRPFLVMELLEGEGFDALLRRERRLPAQRVVALAIQVLDGLGAAHAAGIIHRDMKPANVFVRRTPDPAVPEFVTVLDFGISKIADPSADQQNITQTGAVIGTPVYMAPEQIMNPKEVDRRVDIYATGVMLYEMLSGKLPYEGNNTAELIVKACTMPPIPLRDVAPDAPSALIEVIDRSLARDASARWQTTGEFADALRRSLGGVASLPTTPQGSASSSGNAWQGSIAQNPASSGASAMPMTAGPFAAIPSMATPSHAAVSLATPSGSSNNWGAISPPIASNFAAAPMGGFAPAAPSKPGNTGRTVLIVVGVIGGLVGLCCVGSLAAGYFASDSVTESGNNHQPHMTPIPTPQQIAPTQQPQQPPVMQPQQQPVMQPQQPQMTPMGTPQQGGMVPMAPGQTVQVGSPQVIGTMPVDAVERVLNAAVPSMESCRVSTPQSVEVLAIVQPNGRVAIVRPADDNTGDPSVAQCVGNRFASAGRIDTGGGSGIVRFHAQLAAR